MNEGALEDLAVQLKGHNETSITSALTMQESNLRTRHAKKTKDQKLSLENSRVMELRTTTHDGALEGLVGQLRELNATDVIST